MCRRVGVVCAAVSLVVLAGCSLPSLRAPFGGPRKQQIVVAGPVVEVSGRLQEALSEAGISVLTKFQGGDLRMAGMTKTGKVFCFHLYPAESEGKEKTRILLEWDRGGEDESLWRTVVQPLRNGF
jgi:hypothetical protein